jgi:predicted MPP superfamily phosphohydrolase
MTVRTSNIFLICLIPVLLALVYFVETLAPQVTSTQISSSRLQEFFAGRVVAQISDQHLVEFGWRDRMAVSNLEEIRPDIIFMTGDYIEEQTEFADLEKYLTRISRIAPVIAILGNNDYCCVEQLEESFARAGIPLLRNQAAIIENGADSLYVVGLEDNFLWHDDYFKATAGVPMGAKRIVLGHAPAIAEKIDPVGVELILSGHLHGGQIILPFYGPLARNTVCYVSKAYTSGLYEVNGVPLFSNRGTGTSLLPFRFLSRPEVALFEFTD